MIPSAAPRGSDRTAGTVRSARSCCSGSPGDCRRTVTVSGRVRLDQRHCRAAEAGPRSRDAGRQRRQDRAANREARAPGGRSGSGGGPSSSRTPDSRGPRADRRQGLRQGRDAKDRRARRTPGPDARPDARTSAHRRRPADRDLQARCWSGPQRTIADRLLLRDAPVERRGALEPELTGARQGLHAADARDRRGLADRRLPARPEPRVLKRQLRQRAGRPDHPAGPVLPGQLQRRDFVRATLASWQAGSTAVDPERQR